MVHIVQFYKLTDTISKKVLHFVKQFLMKQLENKIFYLISCPKFSHGIINIRTLATSVLHYINLNFSIILKI